jgi:arylsulfatase A-like enzyme/Flp pilus assembly protein TadD
MPPFETVPTPSVRLRPRWTALFAAAVCLLGALSCGRGGGAGRALVLIVIDTLRADHLGSYGDTEARTPTLDALAARGVRFADAQTAVPVTLPSITTLLTGRYPFHTGVRDNERYVLPASEQTLAQRFRQAGWRTGAVVGSAILAADRGLSRGFETYDDKFTGPFPVYQPTLQVFADKFASTQRRADVVTDRALSQLESFGKDPFFLFVHYFDVHSYYDPPPKYAAMHPGHPYDGEISYVDAEIGRLLDGLKHRSDALVVVVADHGEGLGEHGELEHGFLLYQSTLHVPIIAAGPGLPAGEVRNDPVSLVDLEPTLAAWYGLPKAAVPRDGRALRWATPESAAPHLYAETMRTLVSYGWSELRSMTEGTMKLIAGPSRELYDLAADPHEEHDLSATGDTTALARDLRTMTGGETRDQVLAGLSGDIDPHRKELLESLGYLGTSDAARAPGHVYPDPREELPKWSQAQREKALYRKAMTLALEGNFAQALVLFDSVAVGNPGQADLFYNRGLTKRRLGDEAGFRSDLDRALRLDDRYLPAQTLMAKIEADEGHPDRAQARWRHVLEVDPNNVAALTALSEADLKAGKIEEALPYLRSLVSATPDDADARYNLGLAARQTGHLPEAREHLEAFLRLAPADQRAGLVRKLLGDLPPE